jgi:hypothetical protein
MAQKDLDNPQLVHFANEELRTFATSLANLDKTIVPLLETYNQRDLGTVINDGGAGNFVADGSASDGRTRVTGGDVYNLITQIQSLKQALDTAGVRDVIYKWNVRG